MSTVVLRVAQTLTSWEVERSNLKWPDARASVAMQAGVAPGSLERLERGTLKFAERIGRKLDALFVIAAERKISAIEHELALAKARGSEPEIDVDAVAAALEEVRRLLPAGAGR